MKNAHVFSSILLAKRFRFASAPSMALAACLVAAVSGCGDPVTSMTGTVTYDGKPIPRGVITVNPSDGRGKGEGSKILDGVYEIKSITPGSKTVSVMGRMEEGDATTPGSSEGKSELYGDKQGTESPEVPRDAEGQGQTIEVKEGAQTIDITLGKPGN